MHKRNLKRYLASSLVLAMVFLIPPGFSQDAPSGGLTPAPDYGLDPVTDLNYGNFEKGSSGPSRPQHGPGTTS